MSTDNREGFSSGGATAAATTTTTAAGNVPEEGPIPALPKFAFSEITLGRVMGQGGFSNVNEIVSVDLDEVYDISDEQETLRKEFRRTANSHGMLEGGKFVLKTLRLDLPEEEHCKGIQDLAIEADFLSVLRHRHIIAMRGAANSDPAQSNFFVILDRLTVTLDRKFNFWRKVVGDNTGYWIPCWGYCCSKTYALHTNWMERLSVSRDICRAIHYLHEQNIIYRDLKPDNVGFDSAGVVKIFDFGLAKRLSDVEQTAAGQYQLTGNTGSLRYMAPEVALDQPYNLSVDAYSFGILFWQICSLTTPYAGYSQKMHADRVLQKGQRPKPDPSWPASWANLMERCWNQQPGSRPALAAICHELTARVEELQDDEGVVPTAAWEIRSIKAKKRKHKVKEEHRQVLDVDTRISAAAAGGATASDDDGNVKRFDQDIV